MTDCGMWCWAVMTAVYLHPAYLSTTTRDRVKPLQALDNLSVMGGGKKGYGDLIWEGWGGGMV